MAPQAAADLSGTRTDMTYRIHPLDHVRICIVDYGMGNLASVEAALRFLGCNPVIAGDPNILAGADAYVLPGVGSFGQAADNLRERGIAGVLTKQVRTGGKPFFGICLGMQLVAGSSEEGGRHDGLGWIDGQVVRLSADRKVRVPHVGWSPIAWTDEPYFARIEPGSSFYFDHSYHLECPDRWVAATCDYDGPIVAAIRDGNIFASQFHPEKSQRNGLKLMRAFLNYSAETTGDAIAAT